MKNKRGYHYLCVVENDGITELNKLTPNCMLNLVKYLISEFGDKDYDSVVDLFEYWPVDFCLGYEKPVQTLYINFTEDRRVFNTGYIVYAHDKKEAEQTMLNFLGRFC